MRKKTSIHILSIILVLALLETLLPTAAFAEGQANGQFNNLWDMSTTRSGFVRADHGITASANHFTTPEIPVAAGDEIFFGPANTAQGFHAMYWDASDAATQVQSNRLTVVDTFDNGQAIYRYTVPGDGRICVVDGTAYNDLFLVTKNESFTVQDYDDYMDAKGGNLYRPLLDKTGAFLNADGSFNTYANHNCTHYISVSEGDTLTFGPANTAQAYHLYGFNSSKQQVTGQVKKDKLTVTDTMDDGAVLYTYTIPAGVAYVRIVNATAYRDQFVVTRNNVIDMRGYNDLMGISYDPDLYRKTVLCVGDSITYGSRDTEGLGGWAGRLTRDYGMINTNNGVSGASISTCRENRFGVIVSQLESAAGNSFDYVLIHGGVNDAWDSIEVGTVSKSYDKSTFNRATYAGGLEYTIARAIELYGDHAAIGYLINFRLPRGGYGRLEDMSEYFAAARDICDKWAIPYFDMYNNAEINTALDYETTTYTTDYIHPNPAGYDLLTPYIAGFLKTLSPYAAPHTVTFMAGRITVGVRYTNTAGMLSKPAPDSIPRRTLRGWKNAAGETVDPATAVFEADTVLYADAAPADTVNVALREDLQMNMILDLDFYEKEVSKVTVTGPDYAGRNGAEPISTEYSVQSDLAFTSDGRYSLIWPVAAAQMTDPIAVTVTYSNNTFEQILTGYTVKQYLESVKLAVAGNAGLTALCNATLQYGACAQQAFSYRTDSLAAAVTTLLDTALLNSADYDNVVTGTRAAAGLSRVSTSALLLNKVSLRMYLTPAAGSAIGDFTVTCAKAGEAPAVIAPQPTDTEGKYSFTIPGIIAADFGKAYTFTVTNNVLGTTYTLKTSVLNYGKKVLANSSATDEMKTLVCAIKAYHDSAVAYFRGPDVPNELPEEEESDEP